MIQATRFKQPDIKRLSFRDWEKGVVTAFDDGRTPTNGLRASYNMILDQDGTLTPRPSLVLYSTPTGTILGEIYEFVYTTTSGAQNYLITLQNVAGTTKAYINKDGGTWTVCNGKTYDNTAPAHFVQVDDKVLIMNGTDNLSYFNIPSIATTPAVIPFTALSTPTAPTATKTGNAGTTYTYYYRITANSTVGETAASVAGSVQTLYQREQWDGTTNYVTVTWSAVASASSYNVYMGSVAGQELLVASGINGLSWKDDGSAAASPTRFAPLGDTTAGPKVTRGYVINDQVFLVGDKDYPRYVRFGGTGQNVMDFSPFNGGGWVEIGRGTKEFPVAVKPFRNGTGSPKITVLCRGTNGGGKRYTMTPDTLTVGDTLIDRMVVEEENGQDGTDSPDGVILYNDSLWYPSRDGFKTTGTKPQLQNLLSTDKITNTIQDSISNLNIQAMDLCVGVGYEGRLYWALPVGSDTNNEIWVLDVDRKGAWMKPWTVSAQWMTLYNDNSGKTHFLVLSNNVIYEFSNSVSTNDNGTPFIASATSGLLKFSEDGMDWAKVIDVTFFIQRPQGEISLLVAGKTEDSSLSQLGGNSYSADSSVTGWSENGWGEFGWSEITSVPIQYGDANKPVVVEIDEELQWITWEISSSKAGVSYQLSDVVVRYVPIGTKDLTN